MSFWKQSPGPHWSHFFESLMSIDGKPYVLQKESPYRPNFEYNLVKDEHCEEIGEFLKDHYQTYPGSRVFLTGERLIGLLGKGWIGISIQQNDFISGVVFSRPLGTLAFAKDVMREEAGLVDFFCVHSAKRKSGIGSRLLTALFYETTKIGRAVHIFQKEGYPMVGLPHLWTSTYCWRKREQYVNIDLQKSLLEKKVNKVDSYLPLGAPCWNSTLTVNHTDIYECNGVYVGITDSFHKSVPDGRSIGEVSWVWGKSNASVEVETIVDLCNYDILLMDSSLPHIKGQWSYDARFSYYLFNVQPMRFLDVRPALTF